MNWTETLALRVFFFLMLFFKLINIFLNISSDGEHVIDELVMIGPHLMSAAIILDKTIFLFKSMAKDNLGLFGSKHQRVINKETKSTVNQGHITNEHIIKNIKLIEGMLS